MMLASGLDKHGTNSSHPLKYSHLDIAGSAGRFSQLSQLIISLFIGH